MLEETVPAPVESATASEPERTTLPWADRIPAAIKHAKELTGGCDFAERERPKGVPWGDTPLISITAGEAALAEGYWARYCTAVLDSPVGTPDEEVPPELIKFCEKVEKLT